MKVYILLIIYMCNLLFINGQQAFKESKYFSEQVEYFPGESIQITGERTFIIVESTQENHLRAEVEVISRSVDQDQAIKDLDKVKVQLNKKGKTIFYSNTLVIDNINDKPKSNLRTNLKLFVPQYADLEIINSYGEIELTGQIDKVRTATQFSRTKVFQFIGSLDIDSKFGVVDCLDSDVILKIIGRTSDCSLNNTGGEITVSMQYGSLDMSYAQNISALDIVGKITPITLLVPEVLDDCLTLSCKSCEINTDNSSNANRKDKTNTINKVWLDCDSKEESKSRISSDSEEIRIITSHTISNNN